MSPSRSCRRDHRFDTEFRRTVREVPRGARGGLRAVVRGYRRRRGRVFWVLDVGTGGWRRV